MKILILTTSPRKSFSTSMYFSKLIRFFLIGNDIKIISLKTARDYKEAVSQLNTIDTLIFATPVYVDSIPSTTLSFLEKLEHYIQENKLKFKVYSMLNCGFYEGHQCELAINTYKFWCKKSGVDWCGGIGIGSGVMLGFIRVLPFIGLAVSAIEIVIHAIHLLLAGNLSPENLFMNYIPINLIIQISMWLLFSMGAFLNIIMLAISVRKRKTHEVKFTTVWFCPRILFVAMASIFWILRAILLHGTMPWKLFQKNSEQTKIR